MSKRLDIARAYGFKGTEKELREAASITVSSTPPVDAALGDIWIDPRTKETWVVPPLEARTQSEDDDLEEAGPTNWSVPGDESGAVFDAREKALARAWEITPPGVHRPEPVASGATLRVDDGGSQWIAENTLRWIGYVAPLAGQSDRVYQCMQLAMADMVIRAGETGEVLDLTTVRSYSVYDEDKDQYRVEITVKVVPE